MTTRTLGDLTDDLRQRADLRGMTSRHPDSELQRALLQSLRALRALITRSGACEFIVSSTPTALPTAAPEPDEQYLEVEWPADAVSIEGFDVLISGRWWPLNPVTFASRRDHQRISGGYPRSFCVRTLPFETPDTTLTAGVIQVYPLSTTGETYRIWYLPELPDISNPAHVVQGYDGDWLEWVLWDATIKMAAEDDDVQNVDQIATRERAIVQDRIVAHANLIQRALPISPRRHRSFR